MAKVNIVEKKVQMGIWSLVRFQILTHCYLNKIEVSDSELNCLTLLCLEGEKQLTSFCKEVCDKNIFKSSQTVRNSLSKAEKNNLIIKSGKNKKTVLINPNLKIQTMGNIMLDFKFVYLETK